MEFIASTVEDPTKLEGTSGLMKYVLAKCLKKGFDDQTELDAYLRELRKGDTYKYFSKRS
ncbi:hypothetical protein ACFL0X_00480 [Nanoarchaeota archaeon]